MLFYFETANKYAVCKENWVEFCNMAGKIRWIYNFFVKIILQVKFGGFSAIPPYLYPPLFLPATILPDVIKRTKVIIIPRCVAIEKKCLQKGDYSDLQLT